MKDVDACGPNVHAHRVQEWLNEHINPIPVGLKFCFFWLTADVIIDCCMNPDQSLLALHGLWSAWSRGPWWMRQNSSSTLRALTLQGLIRCLLRRLTYIRPLLTIVQRRRSMLPKLISRESEDVGSSDLEREREGGDGDQSMEGSSSCALFLFLVSFRTSDRSCTVGFI